MTTYNNEVLVDAVVAMMKTNDVVEYPAHTLIKVLRAKAGEFKDGIPIAPNHLSRELNKDIEVLAERGIIMERLHSGKRTIKFTKGESIMETKTYKNSVTADTLEAIKEFGPVTVADIAELVFSNVDSVRSIISLLKRKGEPIASKKAGGRTREKLYYILKDVPKPEKKVVKDKTPQKAPLDIPITELADRAYYLMMALQQLTVEDLVYHLKLDETTATEVMMKTITKYGTRLNLSIAPKTD